MQEYLHFTLILSGQFGLISGKFAVVRIDVPLETRCFSSSDSFRIFFFIIRVLKFHFDVPCYRYSFSLKIFIFCCSVPKPSLMLGVRS